MLSRVENIRGLVGVQKVSVWAVTRPELKVTAGYTEEVRNTNRVLKLDDVRNLQYRCTVLLYTYTLLGH